jgi:hypothetical protein
MILFVTALFLSAGPSEAPKRSTLVRDLTAQVVKLSQSRGSAARIEGVARLADRLAQEGLALAQQPGRVEDALYFSKLSLQLVTIGIAPRLPGAEDDAPDDDARWAEVVSACQRAFDAVESVRSSLIEDQRPRIQGEVDRARPVIAKMATWIAARLERHGTKIAPPDGSTDKPEEKKKDGPEDRPN